MSSCENCDAIPGYHKHWCVSYCAPRQQETRIEYTGNIQVHHPAKPKP